MQYHSIFEVVYGHSSNRASLARKECSAIHMVLFIRISHRIGFDGCLFLESAYAGKEV